MAEPWFRTLTERFQLEKDALDFASIVYTIDDVALSENILRIQLTIEKTNPFFEFEEKEGMIALTAVFPDNYPYFRIEVYADGIALPRHQNIFSKGLCLIQRATESWEPHWTLVGFLQSQLPKVLTKGNITDPQQIAQDSHEQAEPVSEYYPVNVQHPVFFDTESIKIQPEPEEPIKIFGNATFGLPVALAFPSSLCVIEVRSEEGQIDLRSEFLLEKFPKTFEGIIVKSPVRPPFGAPGKDYDWLDKELKAQNQKLTWPKLLPIKGQQFLKGIIGITFPEESSPGVNNGMAWLFLIVIMKKERLPGKKEIIVPNNGYYYARPLRIGKDDLSIRVPKLLSLPTKNIAVVGLGALGAPSAIEFAKNRVGELRIMDFDIIDGGPTVRYPLGMEYAGTFKTVGIDQFIKKNYPNTKVIPINHKLGSPRADKDGMPAGSLEQSILDELLNGVDLLYDATAETGVSNFLSREAAKRGLKYVCLYATPGGLGGSVMRVIPEVTEGCWMCLQFWKFHGDIPVPPKDEEEHIQAAGCGDLTFTGASFDLLNVVNAGVRMTISSLCGEDAEGYDKLDWDVSILSMIDKDKNPTAPMWKTFPLKRHPECSYCAGK